MPPLLTHLAQEAFEATRGAVRDRCPVREGWPRGRVGGRKEVRSSFFHAERHAPLLKSFRDDALIEEVRRAYTGRRQAEKFVLAARMDFKEGNAGSGGGWHLDSPHSLQFKAIM